MNSQRLWEASDTIYLHSSSAWLSKSMVRGRLSLLNMMFLTDCYSFRTHLWIRASTRNHFWPICTGLRSGQDAYRVLPEVSILNPVSNHLIGIDTLSTRADVNRSGYVQFSYEQFMSVSCIGIPFVFHLSWFAFIRLFWAHLDWSLPFSQVTTSVAVMYPYFTFFVTIHVVSAASDNLSHFHTHYLRRSLLTFIIDSM